MSPTRLRAVLPIVTAALAVLAAAAAPTQAAPQVSGVFDLPGVTTNGQLTVGPDGDVWVALEQAVGRVSPTGSVTVLQAADLGDTIGFLTGGITSAGGFIWVSQSPGAGKEALVKIPPSNPAGATGVTGTGITAGSTAVTTGPDGNVWVGTDGKLTKVPPANPAGATTYPITGAAPKAVTASGDGTLWVTDTLNGGRLLNVTTTGAATPYTVGGQPQFLAASPAGQVLFGAPNNSPQQITRLLPGGLPIAIDRPAGSDPFGVAFGADGAFWVAEFQGNRLARVTTDGTLTTLGGLPVLPGQGPRQITAAPGNRLWVTLDKPGDGAFAKIARVIGVDPPPTPTPTPTTGPAAGADVTPPAVAITLSRTRFRAAGGSTAISAARRRTAAGATISVRLSEQAVVKLPIARGLAGRRVGGRCVKPTARNRVASARCTRWVTARTLTRSLPAGTTKVAFTARFSRRALAPGAYRISATATDAAGLTGTSAPLRFTIVRR